MSKRTGIFKNSHFLIYSQFAILTIENLIYTVKLRNKFYAILAFGQLSFYGEIFVEHVCFISPIQSFYFSTNFANRKNGMEEIVLQLNPLFIKPIFPTFFWENPRKNWFNKMVGKPIKIARVKRVNRFAA